MGPTAEQFRGDRQDLHAHRRHDSIARRGVREPARTTMSSLLLLFLYSFSQCFICSCARFHVAHKAIEFETSCARAHSYLTYVSANLMGSGVRRSSAQTMASAQMPQSQSAHLIARTSLQVCDWTRLSSAPNSALLSLSTIVSTRIVFFEHYG